MPARATASYDVRTVIADVLDEHSFLELRDRYAASMVTGLGRLDGRAVGVVANQPMQQAGSLDIDAAQKAARFVQWCDCFNLPVVTFVDTSGYLPGKDLEWRGIIRHGAQLLHAYAAATVPRICVVLRKAYGGAYIVMDSAGLGVDYCIAWPTAEIAVMGAPPAVQILHRRRLQAIDDPTERAEEQAKLVAEYEDRFLNPYIAAERGYVDIVIAAEDTRRVLADALRASAPSASSNPVAGIRTLRCDGRFRSAVPPIRARLQHCISPLTDRKVVVLQGKRILVTGVLNDASIAYSTARLAQEQGAEVILSSFGRVMRLTERTAKRLPDPDVQIVELDVTKEDDLAALAGNVGGKLDGVLHCLAFAPESCLGGGFLDGTLGGRRRGAPGLRVFAEGARRRRAAADGPRRVDRGPRLRQRRRRLACLRLDGRVEGGLRVGCPVPGA